jgi:Zn-dependent M28 family amino/carboxypeptidase
MLRNNRKPYPAYIAALTGAALFVLFCCADVRADDCLDGGKAFEHLRAMVEIGPRPAGSPRSIKTQEYIMSKLLRLGVEIGEQSFFARTPFGAKDMKNIIAVLPGRSRDIIIIGAHYDTKLFKDEVFVGANDGASGSALLLEIARCLALRDNEPTYWFAFFDGEEAFVRWSSIDGIYGSKLMASRLYKTGELANVKAMILLDMVGDSDLSMTWETNSTSWLRKIVWANARKMRFGEYFTSQTRKISDDHIPFLNYGIPSLNIIDFYYGPDSLTNEYWHTPEDTLDKVSLTSLKIIGDVVLESLPQIYEHIKKESLSWP